MALRQTAGAADMKLVIALFMLALLGTAAAGLGLAAWTGHLTRHDSLRIIHYDTKYDLSAQRRMPVE